VNEGTFREDLYYRLAVVEVTLPPLRARREDIATLAQRFYQQAGGKGDLPRGFVESLVSRSWPGNVRELRNFVERATSLGLLDEAESAPAAAHSLAVPAAVLESLIPFDMPLKEARDRWTQSFESVYVRALLERAGGNVRLAARLAGVNRRFLQRLTSRLGLRREGRD
jgi:DNA-binding NtrC family response regulator